MKIRVVCATCGGEPDFSDPMNPVCAGCQKQADSCTCDSAYERIGRTVMALHDRMEGGDDRTLTICRDPRHPPSTPGEVADGLERLLKAARVTAPTDTVRIGTEAAE